MSSKDRGLHQELEGQRILMPGIQARRTIIPRQTEPPTTTITSFLAETITVVGTGDGTLGMAIVCLLTTGGTAAAHGTAAFGAVITGTMAGGAEKDRTAAIAIGTTATRTVVPTSRTINGTVRMHIICTMHTICPLAIIHLDTTRQCTTSVTYPSRTWVLATIPLDHPPWGIVQAPIARQDTPPTDIHDVVGLPAIRTHLDAMCLATMAGTLIPRSSCPHPHSHGDSIS